MADQRTLAFPETDPRHGTYNGYHNHGCRCSACTKANTDYHREGERRRGRRPDAAVKAEQIAAADARNNHGTETRYGRGCRCRACTSATTAARRRRRAKAAA